MKLSLYEQLEEVNGYRFKKDRVERLRLYRSKALETILDIVFNPKVKFLVEGDVKFKPSEERKESVVYRLQQESKKLINFLNTGPYPNLPPTKRMSLLVDTLETLWPKDALLLLAAKDKRLPFPKVTKEVVEEAYPEFKEKWKTNE